MIDVFILGTDHPTFLQHGTSREDERLKARLKGLTHSDVAATIISFEEQARGWLAYIARARSLQKQVKAYARLKRMIDNYRVIPLLDFDDVAAVEYQRLFRSPLGVGSMDLKIAAIALAHNATLITRNLSDFRKAPDLLAEDWIEQGNAQLPSFSHIALTIRNVPVGCLLPRTGSSKGTPNFPRFPISR